MPGVEAKSDDPTEDLESSIPPDDNEDEAKDEKASIRQVMSFAKKARTRLAIVLALILSVASGLVLPSTIYFAFCLGAWDGWLSHLSLPPLTLSLGVVICRSIFGSHGGSK